MGSDRLLRCLVLGAVHLGWFCFETGSMYVVLASVCVCACVHSKHKKSRELTPQFLCGGQRTIYGASSLSLPCESWGWSSGQAWWQTPLPLSAESTYPPLKMQLQMTWSLIFHTPLQYPKSKYNVLFWRFILFLWDRVFLHRPGWFGIHYWDQDGLELSDPPVPTSWVPKLKVRATSPDSALR